MSRVRLAACLMLLTLLSGAICLADPWEKAEQNAWQSREAIAFSRRYAQGWLSHADPATGLLPTALRGPAFWNARDSAADNFPFMVLTAYVTGDYYLKRTVQHIFEQERRLTSRLDSLPDDYLFETGAFRSDELNKDAIIFGASEYAKDGLMPITEWLGPGVWLERMQELIRDIWLHAEYETEVGVLPSMSVEVNGELLQTMSRLYWLTRDQALKARCFRLADYYLLHQQIPEWDQLRLDDHGCEIISGLSEAYLIASREDSERWEKYRPPMHAILDCILEHGINEDGFVYENVNPKTGEALSAALSDNWGYNYNAFLTVAEIDGESRFEEAVQRVLNNVEKYLDYPWEGGGADGYADSIEGGINLLNRIPIPSAFDWVDQSMAILMAKQREDGIIEGWYGDGNSARTALMYALWKTKGTAVSPWREDIRLGAEQGTDGALYVYLESEWSWKGLLRFDRKRHTESFRMPFDYPRINQFPEWFTVEPDADYEVCVVGEEPRVVRGDALYEYPFTLKPETSVQLKIVPKEDEPMLRRLKYTRRSAEEARLWQEQVREELLGILKLNEIRKEDIPLLPRLISTEFHEGFVLREMEVNSTENRRIKVILTMPEQRPGFFPAVVCIHGHGGTRRTPYDPDSAYKGFASELAARGFVTIAADVGQHEVYEPGMILMGERLWDLIRCVDFLESMPEVDASRIGCAGLSLGGEMAMWLAAMDERISACVSSGFLTVMDQTEQNHCMCWKFNGLRDRVDYADVYSLTAPRALQCQNGLKESPTQFCVPTAEKAMEEVKQIYADLGAADKVSLDVHEGGHEIDLPALLRFFEQYLIGSEE